MLLGNDQAIRRALAPLARLAEKHACTILMNRHLTKKTAGQAIYRGAGAIGFIAAVRSAFLVAKDPAADAKVKMIRTVITILRFAFSVLHLAL